MLSIDALDVYYGETQALFGVTLDVAAGEVVALLGPNGAGKTTTLRAILGLTPPRRGTVRFDGDDVTREPTHAIARRGLSWVPDDRRVFPSLTAARNLSIAQRRTRFAAWPVERCCELFPALVHLLPRECENMSGGELQMVSISRALVGAPGVVLLDEPSQGLAPKVVQDVMRAIATLRAQRVGVLVVDQNVRTILEVADRVAVMRGGRIVHRAPAADLRADASERRRWLGG
ncbi:High-affinity branched-chain amino acid transport ATP-binding protein LivF [Burkholderiales bacterium]|nr:High-affinity branched-chain amino acid transport ATP-binding protein LivF [Burkholderiales bacterium]